MSLTLSEALRRHEYNVLRLRRFIAFIPLVDPGKAPEMYNVVFRPFNGPIQWNDSGACRLVAGLLLLNCQHLLSNRSRPV